MNYIPRSTALKPTLLLCISCLAWFAPLLSYSQQTIQNIKIDQFGYRPADEKIAVIADPEVGENSNDYYQPGPQLEIKEYETGMVVFTGSPTAWNDGALHEQSGDKVWWFDFSALQTPGHYVVYDPRTDHQSYIFQIDENVYSPVLKHAMRAFFYQRCGMAKAEDFAGNKWADPVACHVHSGQDQNSRAILTPNNADSERNLSGGWHDAGDFNKYVNFTYSPLHNLLFAYQENPDVFSDDFGIPESGNGIPDILDEVKWELDWLLKMQLDDGQSLMEVSVTEHQSASPPSHDNSPRYYGEASASATRTLASVLAHAGTVFRKIPSMTEYSDTLKQASLLAWQWLIENPGFSTYANTGFANVNPERNEYDQQATQTGASVFLFELTGDTTFRQYFDQNYTSFHSLEWSFWYPFEATYQDILLHYTALSEATPEVAEAILTSHKNSVMSGNTELLQAALNEVDAYRAYLKDDNYVWGSNKVKAETGLMIYGMEQFHPEVQDAHFSNIAADYLHFLHGVNAWSWVMLTNMGDFGAEKSLNEIYHWWFVDGSEYDHARHSEKGPAPGFISGGYNKNFRPDAAYSGPLLAPPLEQPVQKAYRDWNTNWPENSWEITEPAIYYQAAYIRLLAKYATDKQPDPPIVSGIEVRHHPSLQIAPHPVRGRSIHVHHPEGLPLKNFLLYTYDGSMQPISIQQTHISENTETILTLPPTLSEGLYILRAMDRKGNFYHNKVLIQK